MSNNSRFGFMLLLCLAISGCGENVAIVKGRVSLDGKPLPNALVVFQPENGSRPSVSRTDDSGNFELMRTEKLKGAAVGKHKVSVTVGGEVDNIGKKSVIVVEKLPAKYNVKSTLVKEVQPGANEINLDLDSKGEILGAGREPVIKSTCGSTEDSESDSEAAS